MTGAIVTDPQMRKMLARYRAMPPAAKQAFIATMEACATGGAIYPAALRFLRLLKHPGAEAEAARLAADMTASAPRRRRMTREPKGVRVAPPTATETRRDRLDEMIDALLAIELRRQAEEDDLALGIEALAVVVQAIGSDPRHIISNAAGPLKRVLGALHDWQHGSKPDLIFKAKRESPKGGRPVNGVSDVFRAHFAAGVELLICAGVPRKEAGKYVANRIAEAGIAIAGLGGRKLTGSRVLAWRDEVGGRQSQVFNTTFRDLLDGIHALCGEDISRETAMSAVETIVMAAAHRWTG